MKLETKIYKTGSFARRINVHMRTLISWDTKNILKAFRTKTNRRYYTEEQACDYLGIVTPSLIKKNVIYCRVSTKNQKEDLANQEDYIKVYCKNNGLTYDEVINDYGSGLNYNRKGFNELLNRVEQEEIGIIYITHKDRFIRFGYNWFDSFCRKHSCNLIVLDNTEKDVHSELVDDLVSIVHVFSCRLYGLRNYKRKTKLDRIVKKEVNDIS